MNKSIILSSLILPILLNCSLEKQLFFNQKIRIITSQEVAELPQRLEFNWYNSALGCITKLTFNQGKIGYAKIYANELPDALSEEEKKKFRALAPNPDNKSLKVFAYSLGNISLDAGELEEYFSPMRLDNSSYYLARPLVHDKAKPKDIGINDLAELIKSKCFAFYTGAGISIAARVFSMHELTESLGLDQSKLVDALTHETLSNQQEKAFSGWSNFCNAAFNAEPTEAHKTLAEIAVRYNAQIFTENIDHLHERSGILPFHPAKSNVLEKIKPEEFKELDAIICIGLSHDDRALLAYYKTCNPDGILVAIDLKQPNYLSDNDYFVQGDLQALLPALRSHEVSHADHRFN